MDEGKDGRTNGDEKTEVSVEGKKARLLHLVPLLNGGKKDGRMKQ
jgi:hypothetical protein